MNIDKNIIAILQWSDKSTNVFMAHDTKAIEEFKIEKIRKNPDITFTRKDISKSEYDSYRYK
jgi:ABC-type lipopolysaccharide export system ATPase subunit